MEGIGKVHVVPAPDFALQDHLGQVVSLAGLIKDGPVVLAFYPGDFTPVCTKQLCNYRDNIADFKNVPVNICGISADSPESHRDFIEKHGFPFRLLSDPGKRVAKSYGCTSMMMFGGVSRAVYVINKKGLILYRYIERTILTSRKADELIAILGDLKKNGLI
jgi:peroxiredoxin Q/BCP